MKNKILLGLMSLSSSILLAEDHIELGIGFISAKDNLSYIKNKKNISLSKSPTEQEIAVPVLSFEYNGFFVGVGDNTQGIGYRHDFDAFLVEASYNSYEVFENPYLVNQNRKLVDAQELALSISKTYSEFIEFSLSYKNIEIDDKVAKDAQQSANEIGFDANALLLSLSKNVYMGLGYNFTYHDSKRESNTHHKNVISLFTFIELASDYTLTAEVGYERYIFNSKNSYFNKKRNEEGMSIGGQLMVDNLFNNKNSYLKMALFYGKRDSNINFFDTEYTGGSLSYGYKF
ncbi:MAG TPA: DUF2860 domain-containing protein [Sulfurospirillum arcachonense]|nr:DUF2860 domain-containing protein [Sulfurospirillum arcachonense]HIP44976.1 DUF2860 domain-containing protein [Sulfurospirillum arcachonense]